MPSGVGCQYDAGIIDEQCNLKPRAKEKFIKEMKDELTFGSLNMPVPPLFPCGPAVPPNPHARLLNLEDEEKFADFHKNVLGSYQKIACALNLASDFKVLPICDPIALGHKLGVNVSIPNFPIGFVPYLVPNPALLALKMKVMPPPKLIAKFPSIPALPPPIPTFKIPPDVKVPDFSTLFDFSLSFATKIPMFLAKVVASVPRLVLKLVDLPSLFEELCQLAFDSELFGHIEPASITEAVAVKVLCTKVVEMVFIGAIGSTVGSAPGGIVGGIGRKLGYIPPGDDEPEAPLSPRDLIVQYANAAAGFSWGGGQEAQDGYAQTLLYVEYPEPTGDKPQSDGRAIGRKATIAKLKHASSCGMFARACLYAGGASYVIDAGIDTSKQDPNVHLYYDFFKDSYRASEAIAGIYAAAKAKNALIPFPRTDLPPLRYGDVIIVEHRGEPGREHVILLTEDYTPGSYKMTTVEGGQPDINNLDAEGRPEPTAIERKHYINTEAVKVGSGLYSMFVNANNELLLAGRTVVACVDSERLCTDPTGTDMTVPNSFDRSVASDGPGFGFQKEIV